MAKNRGAGTGRGFTGATFGEGSQTTAVKAFKAAKAKARRKQIADAHLYIKGLLTRIMGDEALKATALKVAARQATKLPARGNQMATALAEALSKNKKA